MDYDTIASHSPVFAAWIESNNQHSLEGILECYRDDATMFATFQRSIPTDAERRSYFINLLANPKLHVKVDTLQALQDGNATILYGDYTFSHKKDGINHVIPAGFTMVEVGGKIIHHHSSERFSTKAAESDYDMQDWPLTEADLTFGNLQIKAGFCDLRQPLQSVFDIEDEKNRVQGRYTFILKNGELVRRHVSLDPNAPVPDWVDLQPNFERVA